MSPSSLLASSYRFFIEKKTFLTILLYNNNNPPPLNTPPSQHPPPFSKQPSSLNNPPSLSQHTPLPNNPPSLNNPPSAHIEALAGPSMGTAPTQGLGVSARDQGYLDGSDSGSSRTDKGLSGRGSTSGGGWDWQVSFSAAQEWVDGLDDGLRGSREVHHGLVALLCHPAVATGASVDRALRLAAYEFADDAPTHRHPHLEPPLLSSSSSFSSFSSGGGGAGEVPQPFPETWRVILEASVRVHQDEELRQTLAIVEERCTLPRGNHGSPKAASSSSESSSSSSSSSSPSTAGPHHHMSVALASARLRCYARCVFVYSYTSFEIYVSCNICVLYGTKL